MVVTPAMPAVFAPGVATFAPVMTSAAAPNRQALLIVPAFAGGGETPRAALAQSDAAAYRDLLRLLGFAVTVIAADTRPSLDFAVRGFVSRVTPDADVAVFILGSTIEVDSKLYVPASDLPASERTRDRITTQAIDFADILGRVVNRGPRDVVAIVDECGGGEANPACSIGPGTVPDTVSAIVVHRVARDSGRGPLAGVATIREDLLALMKEPDLSFLKLFSRLKDRLDGTNDALVTTQALSRSFAFLPIDFFQKLPTECNRIDAATSADALRTIPSLAPTVTACENAAETWSFATFFKDKLEVAREQLAFQKAITGCDPGATAAYLDRYPNGSYRLAATDHKAGCDRQNEPPPSPPSPEPETPRASLQDLAQEAIGIFYERHSLRGGLNLQGLAEIYAPRLDSYGTDVTRDEKLSELNSFYAQYSDFDLRIVPGSLNYAACQDEASCLVRGSVVTTKRKVGDSDYRSSQARFWVRFDLRNGVQVTYECSRVVGQKKPGHAC